MLNEHFKDLPFLNAPKMRKWGEQKQFHTADDDSNSRFTQAIVTDVPRLNEF